MSVEQKRGHQGRHPATTRWGRTYGPLIKSEARGVAQVIDDLGNPLVIPMQYAVAEYSQFVSTCRSSTGFVALPNTVITPAPIVHPTIPRDFKLTTDTETIESYLHESEEYHNDWESKY